MLLDSGPTAAMIRAARARRRLDVLKVLVVVLVLVMAGHLQCQRPPIA